MASTAEKEALKDAIRTEGVEFYLSLPSKNQKKELLTADIIKMVEDNMDIIISGENDPEIDIDEIFSRD